MPIPQREHWLKILARETAAYDLAIAAVSGALAVLKARKDGFDGVFWGAITICGLSIGKALATFSKRKREKSTHELEGCLHTIHAYLVEFGGDKVRITIHVPTKDGQHLEQLLEYVGCPPAGRAGRQFPAQSGVVGKAFREKKPYAYSRASDNYDDYVAELITNYNYTEKDARSCSASSYSWMAIPLFKEGSADSEVEGIVYADSNKRDFFTEKITDVCVPLCAGIARFISERYKT